MAKEDLYRQFTKKYAALKSALEGDSIEDIRALTLETHALVHPAEISNRAERTMADYVLDYMLAGHQMDLVPRQPWDTDLHYAGTDTVPLCWQVWHTYRIEDMVSNLLIANQSQIFNGEWQRKIRSPIRDTGNALEPDEAAEFARAVDPAALKRYALAVGRNTREIIKTLTLEQVKNMVPEEWVMNIYEAGGVTPDLRSVWLLVFWGRLTVGGMILTPLTYHHMMHLPPCLDHLPLM